MSETHYDTHDSAGNKYGELKPRIDLDDITGKVTRVTVVPPDGFAQEWRDVEVKIDLQDNGRTLKVFVREPEALEQSK